MKAPSRSKDFENTYGIDHFKIGETTHNLDEYKWLIAQCRIVNMENKINNNKSLTRECKVLSNILIPMKRIKYKIIVITPQYYKDVRTPVVEQKNLEILNPIGQRKQFKNCDW